MSTQYDNFFDLPSNSDGYTLTDAWIAFGGNYVYIEWSNSSIASPEDTVWKPSLDVIQFFATNGNVIGNIVHTTHELRTSPSDSTVVLLKIKLSRSIEYDETVRIISLAGSGIVASSNTESIDLPTNQDTTIRNYCITNSSSSIPTTERSGSSPYLKQSNPLLASPLMSLSDGNMTIEEVRGGRVINTVDNDFNNEDFYDTSGAWIGKLTNFSGHESQFSCIMAIKLPENGSISYSKVTQTNPTDSTDVTGVGRPTVVSFIPETSSGPNSGSTTYEFNDYWTLDESSGLHTLGFSGVPSSTGIGKITDRVIIIGFKSDGNIISLHGGAGKLINKISQTVSLPTLGVNEYIAFRSSGNVKIAEIIYMDNLISDNDIQEYIAYLDDKYATSSQSFYIDPSGLNGLGTIGSPFNSISTAFDNVLAASGDRIYLKNGESILTSLEISLYPDDISDAPLGYSVDYPFIFGSYDSRSLGRPVIDFESDTSTFLESSQHNENILIYGLHLKSSERDINDPSFVGQTILKSEQHGHGIQLKTTGTQTDYLSTSLSVYDCEIQNTLRHGIVISTLFGDIQNGYKYSSVSRTMIHDLYNMNYMAVNQNHTLGSSDYGIAGIYSEKTTGLHIENCMFFRVGWSPNLILDTGISTGTLEYRAATNSIVGFSLAPFTDYDVWDDASNIDHNNQRLNIIDINGSPTNEVAFISSGIDSIGAEIGFYLKSVPSMSEGDTCSINVLDPIPRCSGNADIIIGSNSVGNMTICDTIFVESSGHTIISYPSFYQHGCISYNNQFGTLLSELYTKLDGNFIGGSSGTGIIRKSPNTTTSNIIDEVSNHGWWVKSQKDVKTLCLEMNNNILSGENGYGFEDSISNITTSAGLYFDKNTLNIFNAIVEKNTFYSIPGVAIAFYTENSTTGSDFKFHKNIIDQEFDYTSGSYGSSATSFIYGFKDPHTDNWSNIWGVIDFGEESKKGLYNQQNITIPPSSGMIQYFTPSNSDIGYLFWDSVVSSDRSVWQNVTYTDAGRSLATYNSSVLLGSTSAIDFVSTAISEHNLGWSSGVSSETIMNYITTGWQPTNLDQIDFNEDYIGAVEFNFTTPPSTYKPFFGSGEERFGHGKGN